MAGFVAGQTVVPAKVSRNRGIVTILTIAKVYQGFPAAHSGSGGTHSAECGEGDPAEFRKTPAK